VNKSRLAIGLKKLNDTNASIAELKGEAGRDVALVDKEK